MSDAFPKDARASAQGLFNVMILGAGVIAANSLCPRMMAAYTTNGITDFRTLFLFAGGVALAAAITLALFFHPPAVPAKQSH